MDPISHVVAESRDHTGRLTAAFVKTGIRLSEAIRLVTHGRLVAMTAGDDVSAPLSLREAGRLAVVYVRDVQDTVVR